MKKRLNILLKKYIISKLKPKLFNLKQYNSISIKKLDSGCYNLNYLVNINSKKFVFRLSIYKDEFEGGRLKEEYNILKQLRGLHCPKVFHQDNNFKYPFLIEEFIEGKKIKKLSNVLIKDIAKALADIHLKSSNKKQKENLGKLYNRIFDKRLAKLKENPKIYKELSQYVSKAKIYLKKNKIFEKYRKNRLLHGDMRCENILIRDKKIIFIDWENSKITDPVFDIVAFFYESENLQYFNKRNSISIANKNLFLKEYLKINQDNHLKEKINIIYPLRWLADTLWLACRLADYDNIPLDLRDKSKKEYLKLYQFNIKNLEKVGFKKRLR